MDLTEAVRQHLAEHSSALRREDLVKLLVLHREQPVGKCWTCSYTNWMQMDVGEWPCATFRVLAETCGLGELLPARRETDDDLD